MTGAPHHLAVSPSFAELGLSSALVQAAAALGYGEPTPIQAAAIPPAMQGRDVLGIAPTGSGKTGAFGLALLQRLECTPRPVLRPTRMQVQARVRVRALVLVPTRELAAQVGEALSGLSRGMHDALTVVIVSGGVSVNPQMLKLRGGADIIVATPGRLLDLVQRNAVNLSGVEILVLDEADRLLGEGFADELVRLKGLLPAQRQGLFFSATFPAAVQALAAAWLHEPLRLDLKAAAQEVPAVPATIAHVAPVAPMEPNAYSDTATIAILPTADPPAADAEAVAAAAISPIEQRAIEVDTPRRTALLRHLIAQCGWPRALVFVATRHASEHVADKLRRAGLVAAAFHGELSQGARTRALSEFSTGALQVLVATDMAARGLHIPGLPVVVNYDLPRSATDHTHRIGRTARAGATGLAVSFVTAATEAHFRLIEKRQGQRVRRERIAGFEPSETVTVSPLDPGQVGGIKGKRKSKKDRLREAAAAAAG